MSLLNDTIAALRAVKNYCGQQKKFVYAKVIDNAMELLEHQDTRLSGINLDGKWIPTDRGIYPDEDDIVFVQTERNAVGEAMYCPDSLDDESDTPRWEWMDGDTIDDEVVAWMPLDVLLYKGGTKC